MMEANAILHLLAPPIRLMNWLEKLIAAKEARGREGAGGVHRMDAAVGRYSRRRASDYGLSTR
jgi:hypothetical protein